MSMWPRLAVFALTALGFALRVRGIHEGLYRDELITYADVHGRSLAGVLDAVANGAPGTARENNPPLYFILAWIGSQFGDPSATIRLPSLILGSATVPLVYLVGRRTVGTAAALFGAAFIALSPFAIFYGIEARAYGSQLFFSSLSVLALVCAVERRRPGWWAAYAVSVAAVLYTHYVGALVIATEAAWAIWVVREWRPLVATYLGAALLYLPWLPFLNGSGVADFESLAAIVGVHDWEAFLQWVGGWPESPPSELPDTVPLVLLAVGAGIGLGGTLLRREAPWQSPRVTLVFLMAVTTPVVLLVYGLVGDDLFVYPRNMSAALPFLGLALGWLVTRPPLPAAAPAAAIALAAVAIGAHMTLEDRFHRPDSPAVADLLDDRLDGADPVVYYGPGLDPLTIGSLLRIYQDERHPVRGANPIPGSLGKALSPPGRSGRPVLAVEFVTGGQAAPIAAGWEHLRDETFAGSPPLRVSAYSRVDADRHRGLSSVPRGETGLVDSASLTPAGLMLSGWALTRAGRPADRVLAYVDGRLAAAGFPDRERPDVSEARGVPAEDLGFLLALPRSLDARQRHQIRVVATSRRAATPLDCRPDVRELIGCTGDPVQHRSSVGPG